VDFSMGVFLFFGGWGGPPKQLHCILWG